MKPNKLAFALAGLLLSPAVATYAQTAPPAGNDAGQPPPQSQNAQELQTITVTGSALPRVDVETPSPVVQISAAQIERSGLKTISDVIRAISADNSGSIPNAFTAGFAAGSSGVALRGLTVNSTLVLIDGRRSASYGLADDGQRSFVDLNSIPVNAIERIEVLKDGASSLYGADAIAGVVNIILKHDFKGLQASADVGTSQKGGGTMRRATFLFGGGDLNKDGYNAYLSIEAQKDDPIKVSDRGFPFDSADLSSVGGDNAIGGQPSLRSGSIYGTVRPGTLGVPGDITTGVADPGSVYQPLRPCGPGTSLVSGDANNPGSYCAQNFARLGQIQPESKRLGVYGRLTVKVGETSEAYIGASYYQNETQTTGAPAQIQTSFPNNTNSLALPVYLSNGQLNPNNPFAAQGKVALINYAFPELDNNGAIDNTNHNLRVVGGIHGTFGEWNYDSALVINHTSLDVNNYQFLNYAQLLSDIRDGSYNFIDPSKNSRATVAALAPTLNKTSTTDLQSLDFHVSRALMDLKGGSLGFATGVDLRHEEQSDPDLNPGNAAQGIGVAHTFGKRTVGGLYAEFDAPLLESLEVDVSGRYDHYSDFGSNISPKVGFKWKPFDSLAIRGTYSKGFRAPSFAENGSSEAVGFAGYTVPDDFAAAHGNDFYTRRYVIGYDSIGNDKVKPEKSRSYTFGVVYQPIDQLSASVDYYDIKKTGVIAQADTSAVLAAYYAGLPLPPGTGVTVDKPDPLYPDAMARPAIVAAPYVNQNALRTKGVDVDLIGRFDLGASAKLTSELTATKIIRWDLTLQDGSTEHFVGTHGPYGLSSGAGTPRYRASWANSVSFGPATITGTLYYTSGLKLTAPDQGEGCLSTNADGDNLPASCRMASFTTFDLTGSYAITDHFSVNASVLNAFGRKAPFDPFNYAALNYNPTYAQSGAVGRFYTLGVKFKL
ncbi:TonB-dependent receptor [Frateuria sp. Soil773]|uniref:TonB-dependent receptor plug domain-containing protein n=1 Tax=Frateuria sp. Soil773 TaxID=1736407 RepID=UPI0009EAF0AC|nr:TonB-dependent receptor [Frateuria sp. Soil773]